MFSYYVVKQLFNYAGFRDDYGRAIYNPTTWTFIGAK